MDSQSICDTCERYECSIRDFIASSFVRRFWVVLKNGFSFSAYGDWYEIKDGFLYITLCGESVLDIDCHFVSEFDFTMSGDDLYGSFPATHHCFLFDDCGSYEEVVEEMGDCL